jgi:hypothetical protein
MTDESDAKVSRRYRELDAEEPPRALDDAILAASRKATRPWTQRYAVPLGLAAVLVLSVTVTLRMQHERPGIELPESAQKETVAMAPAQEAPLKLKAEVQIKAAAEPARQRAARREQGEPKPFPSQAPAAAPPASADMLASRADMGRGMESSVAGAAARNTEERTSRDAEAAARAPQVGPLQALAKRPEAATAGKLSGEAPEAELERIAALRRDGKHDEADKALAEFRQRLPDYKMTDAMRERVERR